MKYVYEWLPFEPIHPQLCEKGDKEGGKLNGSIS